MDIKGVRTNQSDASGNFRVISEAHNFPDWDKREQRRIRRYRKLACSKLPDWAPEPLRLCLSGELRSLAQARRVIHESRYNPDESHPRCTDPLCHHCRWTEYYIDNAQQRVDRLIRLTSYPDMQSAWNTIATRELKGPIPQKKWAKRSDHDLVGSLFVDEIHRRIETFERLPKRTASQKKHGAGKVARLAKQLAGAIKEDADGRALSSQFFRNYIGARNLRYRIEQGESPSQWLLLMPSFGYEPDPGAYEDIDGHPWDKWPVIEKYRWLHDEVQKISLQEVLSEFSEELELLAGSKPAIARPRSGDPRVRYMIDGLSEFMEGWYGSPLDDTVACFVSASLNLPTPLTRDDVKPRRKRFKGT